MKKRFVVMIDSVTEDQNKKFLAWVKEENVGWWHWFDNSWLISNNRDHLTAATIRDKAMEIYSGENVLVLELHEGEGTWSGFGPNSGDKDMFKWIRDNWS